MDRLTDENGRLKQEPLMFMGKISDHVFEAFGDTITVNEIVDAVWDELKERDVAMEVEDIHLDEYYCPACGAENSCNQRRVEDNFCPVCGQRLKVKNEGIEW